MAVRAALPALLALALTCAAARAASAEQQAASTAAGAVAATLPAGAVSLLASGVVPERATSMLQVGLNGSVATAAGGAAADDNASSTVPANAQSIVLGGLRLAQQVAANEPEPFNSTEFNVNRRTLGVVGDVFSLTSGTIKIVSKSLGLYQKTLAVVPAQWKRWTSRAKFLNSGYSFGQTLYNDFNKFIDNSDYLGDSAKYIQLWNNLGDALAGGALETDVKAQIERLTAMQALLSAVNK